MNRFNPKKLRLSKWTALNPVAKEKHFIVIDIEYDEEIQKVLSCTLEAVMTKRQRTILPEELKNEYKWRQGWQ